MNTKDFLKWISRLLPDKMYISLMYYRYFHKWPNIEKPKTYNEKIQWLKLHDRNKLYNIMADKYRVKEYVAKKIGSQYVVPLLAVWENVEEMDISTLPKSFVLKCNNGHGVIVCRDKENFNLEVAKQSLDRQMRTNLFWHGREWVYRDIPSCIIAEEFIGGEKDYLTDYKVMCFDGKAEFIQVLSERGVDNGKFVTKVDFYDKNWNKTTISQEAGPTEYILKKPAFFEEMISLSETLAEGITNVRVDWYYENNQLLFGEMTFYDGSGFVPFNNPEDDAYIGSFIQLPIS